jgi:hypothetical protein
MAATHWLIMGVTGGGNISQLAKMYVSFTCILIAVCIVLLSVTGALVYRVWVRNQVGTCLIGNRLEILCSPSYVPPPDATTNLQCTYIGWTRTGLHARHGRLTPPASHCVSVSVCISVYMCVSVRVRACVFVCLSACACPLGRCGDTSLSLPLCAPVRGSDWLWRSLLVIERDDVCELQHDSVFSRRHWQYAPVRVDGRVVRASMHLVSDRDSMCDGSAVQRDHAGPQCVRVGRPVLHIYHHGGPGQPARHRRAQLGTRTTHPVVVVAVTVATVTHRGAWVGALQVFTILARKLNDWGMLSPTRFSPSVSPCHHG